VDLLWRGIRPRLIILDLVLPKVDGWTILKHLHEDKDLRQIPVIVTTALRPEHNPPIKGADVVLEKPLDSNRRLAEIKRLLESVPSR
jgi:CheY-like chemotaxis protein